MKYTFAGLLNLKRGQAYIQLYIPSSYGALHRTIEVNHYSAFKCYALLEVNYNKNKGHSSDSRLSRLSIKLWSTIAWYLSLSKGRSY